MSILLFIVYCCCLLLHLCLYVQALLIFAHVCTLLIQYDITPEIGLSRFTALLKCSGLSLATKLLSFCLPVIIKMHPVPSPEPEVCMSGEFRNIDAILFLKMGWKTLVVTG